MSFNAKQDMHGNSWLVLHTCSHRERVVAAHLESRDVQSYLPVYTVDRKRSDRKVTLDLPLFPGYLFARFSRSQQLLVVSVPGFLRILEVPGGLARIADSEIMNLKEGLLEKLKVLPATNYMVGDKVRILTGPFQDNEACVIESTKQFIRVLMSIGNVRSCSFTLDVVSSDIEFMTCANTQRYAPASRLIS